MPIPTEFDVAARLFQAGLRSSTKVDDGDEELSLLARAWAEFESATGWRPFIAGPQSTVTLRKKGTIIEPRSGILSLVSAVVDHVALEEGTGFRFIGSEPPYRGIELRYCPTAPIVLTGVFGFCLEADCPGSVSEAILDRCCERYAMKTLNVADVQSSRTDLNSMARTKSQVERWRESWAEAVASVPKRNLLW